MATSDPQPYAPEQIGQLSASGDPRTEANYLFRIIKALLTNGIGTSNVTTIVVPSNRQSWTDTGINLNIADALTIEATGTVSESSSIPPYLIQSNGFLRFHAIVVSNGVTPSNTVIGNSYALSSALSRQVGRVWVRVHDYIATSAQFGDYSDNQGEVTATLNYYSNAAKAPAPTVVQVLQSNVAGLKEALALKLNANQPIFFPNVTTEPDTPVGGVVFYAQDGVAKVKNAAGTVFTIGG